MGTHYSLNKEPGFLEERFEARFDRKFEKVYHVSAFEAPAMPVITSYEPCRFSFLSWGLVPFWVRDKEQAEHIRMKTVNARADTLFEKPSFRIPAKKKRCIIPVDGYFEWREEGGKTYPYYIHRKDNDAFALAGIWDEWTEKKSGKKRRTFSMISIAANRFISEINNRHKRMPVILPRDEEKKWIKPDLDEKEIKSMLKTYEGAGLEAYPVKRIIGRKGKDSNTPEVLEECEPEELKNACKNNNKADMKQFTLF